MDILLHAGQLMIMGGKKRLTADVLADKFYHTAGDTHAVKGRCTAADFIQNDKAVLRGVFENFRHLGHLHHEGGLSRSQIIRRTHAGENGIHHTDVGAGGGHKAANLRHQGNQRVLAHIGGLTSHIRAGNQQHTVFVLVQQCIVRHKQAALEHLLNDRVAALFYLHHTAFIHGRHHVVVLQRSFRKACQHIQLSHSRCCALNADNLCRDA